LGCSQGVRQRFLVPPCGGSNPPIPANNFQTILKYGKLKFVNATSKIPKSSSNKLFFSDSSFEEDFFNSDQTYVHPTSIVGPNVELDKNVKIGPFCIIAGKVKIQSGTILHSHVSVGAPAQNLDTKQSLGTIEIGKNCDIREFVTIGASKYPNGKTTIGNKCYVMSYSHIAHDVTLEDNVVLINNVNLGGHVYVEKNAWLMANSAAHHFCRIGQFCALTPFSAIRQDLPPFCMFVGLPAKFSGLHLVALKRAGFNFENLNALKHVTKLFYQNKLLLDDINSLAQKETEMWWSSNKKVQQFLEFVKNSKRGVSKKTVIQG
jgi:UDP-N-acetylglucosamine acyltransferase